MSSATLLASGECPQGHVILSEEGIKIHRTRGRTYRYCRACFRERRRGYRRKKRLSSGLPVRSFEELQRLYPKTPPGQFRRHIVLSCGHQPIFDSNPGGLPVPKDIILCKSCDDYRTVVCYGDPAPKEKR